MSTTEAKKKTDNKKTNQEKTETKKEDNTDKKAKSWTPISIDEARMVTTVGFVWAVEKQIKKSQLRNRDTVIPALINSNLLGAVLHVAYC